MNSLLKLSAYSDSDSDSGEESEESQQCKLPLPSFLSSSTMKPPSNEANEDGKVRNFPHEPGNWATYIYTPLDISELLEYLKALVAHFEPLNLKLVDDFHISLSKTVVLRHHWILSFTKSVQQLLAEISSFRIHLFGLKAYTNENKTRSFLSLTVDEGEMDLKEVVSRLDKCLRDYNLQGYYDEPSFHVSLLWCPGDRYNEINKYIDSLPLKLKNFGFHKQVSHCVCASGNKRFNFPLNR